MSPKSQRRRGPDQGHRDAAYEHRKDTPGSSVVDLDALALRLAPLVAVQIAKLLAGASEPQTYSTRREGPRPPEFATRGRAWRDLAPSIPGASKLGRWYTVTRADFEAWRSARSPAPVEAKVEATPDEPWSPATVARDLGLRLVGQGGAR